MKQEDLEREDRVRVVDLYARASSLAFGRRRFARYHEPPHALYVLSTWGWHVEGGKKFRIDFSSLAELDLKIAAMGA